jgi:hypothetical protein
MQVLSKRFCFNMPLSAGALNALYSFCIYLVRLSFVRGKCKDFFFRANEKRRICFRNGVLVWEIWLFLQRLIQKQNNGKYNRNGGIKRLLTGSNSCLEKLSQE